MKTKFEQLNDDFNPEIVSYGKNSTKPGIEFKPDNRKIIPPSSKRLKEADSQPAITPDIENQIPLLIASITKSQVKQRVLSILSHLEKVYWLENNIKIYIEAVNIESYWFDAITFLNWYAHCFKPRNYLEVGVCRGRSLAQVLVESPETKAYGFDKWIPDYGSVPEKSLYATNPGPNFVLKELKKLGVTTVPTLIDGDSHVTLPLFFSDFCRPSRPHKTSGVRTKHAPVRQVRCRRNRFCDRVLQYTSSPARLGRARRTRRRPLGGVASWQRAHNRGSQPTAYLKQGVAHE